MPLADVAGFVADLLEQFQVGDFPFPQVGGVVAGEVAPASIELLAIPMLTLGRVLVVWTEGCEDLAG